MSLRIQRQKWRVLKVTLPAGDNVGAESAIYDWGMLLYGPFMPYWRVSLLSTACCVMVHWGVASVIKVKVAQTRLPSVGLIPELIPVLGSQPAGDVTHKPGGRLPLLSARPVVTHATLKRAATNFAAW